MECLYYSIDQLGKKIEKRKNWKEEKKTEEKNTE